MTSDAQYIDWDLARRTGRRVVSDGPRTTAQEAAAVVEELRAAALRSHDPVATTARLQAPNPPETVSVVDRGRWIDVNCTSMAAMIAPAIDKITATKAAGPAARAVSSKVGGTETGLLLGYVATKVLGQYDLAPGGIPQLLLVAPNVVEVERTLDVDPHDFRMWVCLHEETHRVQFTAVPWLREHMIERAQAMVVDLVPDPAELPTRLQEVVRRLPQAFSEGGQGLADLLTTPAQREELARVTAIMSLLEGHADVVMDEVGPQVVPSVEEIRSKFDERRKGRPGPDRLLRRLLGLEAKMRQYRDGAVFVRSVVDRVGWDGFNVVWTSPDTLPQPLEITQPEQWVARVHG